jgi:hypothetical protein
MSKNLNNTSKQQTYGLRKFQGFITGKVTSALNVTKTQRLVKNTRTRFSDDCPRGSGYCEEQVEIVFRVTEWRVRSVLVWSKRERLGRLDQHESISSATLGSRF